MKQAGGPRYCGFHPIDLVVHALVVMAKSIALYSFKISARMLKPERLDYWNSV